MSSPLDSPRWLPLVVALVETLVAELVLHGAVGRAMQARGMAWRLRDTMLVSPLLVVGLLLFFASMNYGPLFTGRPGAAIVASAAVGGVGLVIAWFGGRAVGKLY